MNQVKHIFNSPDFRFIESFIRENASLEMGFNLSFSILNVIFIFESKGLKILHDRKEKTELLSRVETRMNQCHEELDLV